MIPQLLRGDVVVTERDVDCVALFSELPGADFGFPPRPVQEMGPSGNKGESLKAMTGKRVPLEGALGSPAADWAHYEERPNR